MASSKPITRLLDKHFTGGSVLGRRVFFRSFVIMLVITSIALTLQFFIELRHRDNTQVKDLSYTVEALSPSFVGAIWNLNDRSINTLLTSLTTRSEVFFAYVSFDYQFTGIIESEAGLDSSAYQTAVSFATLKKQCDTSISKDLVRVRAAQGVVVTGELFVCYVSPKLDAEFLVGTFTQYIPHLLAILLVSILFVMMIVQTVMRPLNDIIRNLGEGGGILELQPGQQDKHKEDEFDQLIKKLKINTSALLKERGIADAALMRIADGVAVTDKNFNLLRMNTGLESIVLGDSNVLKMDNLQNLIPIPLSQTIEESIEFESGDERILEVFGTKIESMHDDLEYVFLIRDLTEKRRMLEATVQTQKQKALDTLAGGLAHDFNNLLMIINGNLELYQLTEPKHKAQNTYIKVALKAVQNGRKLTNKLLAFSRKQQLSNRFIFAGDVIESVATLVKSNLDPAINIRIEVNTEKMVFVDESFLESALLNLIVNSCDAMPDGGNIVLNTKDRIIQGKAYVEFSVADNGAGITSADIAQVCTPFYTTKRVGKGTGLGLSMVQGFAEQSGGLFEISSEFGQGTQSVILLPSRVAPSNVVKVPSMGRLSYDCNSVDPINILVIDDNRQVCSLLKQQIENLGHAVTTAHSVDELRTLSNELGKVELVICDVVLKGESVIDVQKVLKEQNVPAPLVLISGSVPKSLTESVKRLNTVEFIRKPFSIEKLNSVIESIPRSAA